MSPGGPNITLTSAEDCVKPCQACEHDLGSVCEGRGGGREEAEDGGYMKGMLLPPTQTRQMMHRQMALDIAAMFSF